MATIKQKLAFNQIVENRGNVSRAMLEVGYDPDTAKNPKNLTESKGYKELLKQYGLTEELVIGSLVEDIKAKPKKRYLELSLGAELLRIKKPESGGGNTYNTIVIGGDQAARVARRTIARLSGGTEVPNRLPDSNEPQV